MANECFATRRNNDSVVTLLSNFEQTTTKNVSIFNVQKSSNNTTKEWSGSQRSVYVPILNINKK